MSGHTSGMWWWVWDEGRWKIFAGSGKKRIALAKVFSKNVDNPKANTRLIVSAPEMYVALSGAVEALRATEIFMRGQGLETDTLNGIIETIDDLLARIDED